ncbi:dynamin family protein [Psychromonas sp. Urea-02u-13]|uniref:dynamin family protein n=1 Tax=Psychromonas sp. Urea-02u-13 TaxID=2058326 RepID=UPI0012FF2256|nr:dynamin family protein [Psychromonas sp. Urea-02u-13]
MVATTKIKKAIEIVSDNTKITVNLFNDFFKIKELEEHYTHYLDTAKELKSQLDNQEFRITVVGEFSSGKSTFINALIGQDILLHGLSETTATVTYVHCVKKDNSKINQIEVHFTEPSKQPVILDLDKDKDLLKQYTTTFSNTVDVVSEIEGVHFYLNIEGIEDNVVFIDTPGLNGVAEGHREVTINEIQKAHASICLFQLRGVTESEKEFLELVCKYQNNTIFVMNRIDELNEREDRSYDEQIQFFHQKLQESIGDPININIPKSSIFGLSSLLALVANDHSIKKIYETDKANITGEQRQTMWQTSRFSSFQNYLWHDVIEKQKEQLLKRSICERFDIVLSALLQEITAEIAILTVDVIDEDLLKIDSQLEKIDLQKGKNSEKIQNFIANRQRELIKDFKYEITLGFQNIIIELTKRVDSETDFDNFYQNLNNNDYGNALAHQLADLKIVYKKSLTTALKATYQEATERTESFVPRISISNKRIIKIEHHINTDFSPVNLTASKNKIHSKIHTIQQQQIELKANHSLTESKVLKSEINHAQMVLKKNKINQDSEVKRLGIEPAVQNKRIEYQTTESRGGTGFLDFMIGEKEVTRTRVVKDSSNRDAWNKNKLALSKQFTEQKIESERRINQLKGRYVDEQNKQSINDTKIENLSRKIKGLENDLEFEQKVFDEIYSKNKREALKNAKMKLVNKIAKQIAIPESDIYLNYQAELNKDLEKNCLLISKEVTKYLEYLHKQFKQNLLTLSNKRKNKLGFAETEQKTKKLTILANKIQKIQVKNINGANSNAR